MRLAAIISAIVLAVLLVTGMSGCTFAVSSYNALQRRDERVKQTFSELLSVYQKRADMVPNLVQTVKGYAEHESDVFKSVTEARARAGGSIAINMQGGSDADIARFAAAQKELTGALTRLLAVAENYPNLKADQSFLRLQTDLRDIETQATAARNRYVREVAAYNVNIRSFPSNLVAGFFGYSIKPQLAFEDENQIKRSPRVDFGYKQRGDGQR